MEPSSYLQFLERQKAKLVEKCVTCGACLDSCPVFPLMKYHRLGSKKLMEAVIDALGDKPPTEEAYNTVYGCAGCGQCNSICPAGISPALLMLLTRSVMDRHGWKAPDLLYRNMEPGLAYNFVKVLSGLQMKPTAARWLPRVPQHPEATDVVLFLGCYSLSMPSQVFTLLDIFDQMGLNFTALGGDDLCCGSVAYLMGRLAESERKARELVSGIMAFHPKRVVFMCGSCHWRFNRLLPKFIEVPFRSESLPQFLVDNLDKIPFRERIDKLVTYQDSCTLKRDGQFDAPRKLLQSIPGVRLVEMEHNRENALCCGAVASRYNFGIAREFQQTRMREAKASGADLLVCECLNCYSAFAGLDKQYIEVVSEITLLGKALGIEYEDKFKNFLHSPDLKTIIESAREYIESNHLDRDRIPGLLAEYLDGLRVTRA